MREASIVVVNLYRMSASTPAATAPKNACTGEGGDLVSAGESVTDFKLSNASSLSDFFSPDDLNFCFKKITSYLKAHKLQVKCGFNNVYIYNNSLIHKINK